MTVERILRWTCDSCGAIAERDGYGFPAKGWTAVPADARDRQALQNRVTLNECPACSKLRAAKTPREPAFEDWHRRHPERGRPEE